jgi:hypothetical protein
VGDLICKSRAGSGATYDNIRPGMTTHCDIVTEVRPGTIAAVGGNVSNSVAQSNVRTDSGGRIIAPNYFAVIRVDNQQPSTPVVPVPTPPQPSAASPPRLLKQESTPPGVTLYAEIDLKIVDKAGIRAPSVTGIFVPDGYQPGATVDVVLYLHGFKAEAIKREAIDQYWNSQRFPYGALREGVNASARNVVLVAPTLGSRSEAGSLLKQGGLDAFIGQVLAALGAYGHQSRAATAPRLGNLIFACHSGGGWPMRQIAGGSDRALARVRECWGFDCTYNGGDDAFWAKWARARPSARVFIYYISGSKTAPLAQSLRNMRVPNATVQASRDRRHNYVPITHWQERLQGASFLGVRSGGSTQPVPPSPSKAPTVPPPGVNYPPPPGYRALRGRAPREVVAKAQEILHRPDPIGTQIPLSIGGKDYLFAVEWHKHAPTDPVPAALKRWHRGVTVYERGNGSLPRPSGPSAPSGYVPSLTRRRFDEAAARNDWREAFLNLNGLNMYEMLRALDGLAPDRRGALKSQREAFRGMVNMPRIEYAAAVVETRQLPSEAPGDLAATGQVQTAAEFLRQRRPQPTKLAWGARVSPEFRRRVKEICAGLECDPNHLMAAMAFESAETFSPSVRNRLSGATGLIQFMPSTAQRLGTTTDALAAMTAEQQLDYVSRYFSPYRGRLGTLEDVYMVILWPKAVGAPNDAALFAKPSTAYEQNKALDVNGDGVVSKFEAAQFVRAKLTKGLGAGYVG